MLPVALDWLKENMKGAIATTVAAVLAYLASALLVLTAQTPPFMLGFVASLFGITTAYVHAVLGPRPHRKYHALPFPGPSR
jgi:tetrahydromethanopterin S-methyltransferase subunit E